jgi:hypothetical protein
MSDTSDAVIFVGIFRKVGAGLCGFRHYESNQTFENF